MNALSVVLFQVFRKQQEHQSRIQRGVSIVSQLLTASWWRMMSSAWFRWKLHVHSADASGYLTQYQRRHRLNAMIRILGQFRRNQMRVAWQLWTTACVVAAHQAAMAALSRQVLVRVIVAAMRRHHSQRLRRAFLCWVNYAAALTRAETDRVRTSHLAWL